MEQLAAGSDPAIRLPIRVLTITRRATVTATAGSRVHCAAVSNGQAITFNGVAPKAFLGNYKVFGSPNVNDAPPESVFILAIEDAVKDGMDVANVSAGFVARSGVLDTGAACGLPAGTVCDPIGMASENAVKAGLVIVAAVGNNGFDGDFIRPAFNTIATPAAAPSVIAVGSSKFHVFFRAWCDRAGRLQPAGNRIQTE
jgi:hypothetical protein